MFEVTKLNSRLDTFDQNVQNLENNTNKYFEKLGTIRTKTEQFTKNLSFGFDKFKKDINTKLKGFNLTQPSCMNNSLQHYKAVITAIVPSNMY